MILEIDRRPEEMSLDAQNSAIVAKACRLIETEGEPMSLDELALAVELSPHYFHRMFKAKTGLTPREYAPAQQAARVRRHLESAPSSITQAIYDARFNQRTLGRALREIPAGKTVSYVEIARRIGAPAAVRNDGGLSGYRWGVERKRTLLERESLAREPSAARKGDVCPFVGSTV